ncbi:putative protein kinase RLK-Pelle-SD-2b family [Dioscorea sansibarensis]
MEARNRACLSFPVLVCFVLTFVSSEANLSAATNSISTGQSISGNLTIISEDGTFELGFFTPGNSRKFYIGIWYKKLPKQTIIWVANRERFISNTTLSELKLTQDRNLVLLNQSKIPIWSSNSSSLTSSNHTEAVLLNNGNLVLRDMSNTSVIFWQSFDHPTDTFVPESWIGMNKVTGEYQSLTSWKNSEDPAPGYFSDSIDPGGTSEFFLRWNKSEIYWRSGTWNGEYFTGAPVLPEMRRTTIINLFYIDNDQRRYATCTLKNNATITRQVIDVSGQIKQLVWLDKYQDWLLFWSEPDAQCDVYSLCGPFGICDSKSIPFCRCPQGFEPASMADWELNDYSSGCVRRSILQCGKNTSDGFLTISNMKLPSNSHSLDVQSSNDCSSACLNDCSCTAYAYGDRCFIWKGELLNLQQLYGDGDSTTLYLRVSATDIQHTKSKSKALPIILSAVGAVILSCILVGLAWRIRRSRMTRREKLVDGSLVVYSYAELQHITRNFSEKLGSGGFGSVFRGSVPGSNDVAVKRLEELRQVDKQFIAEVSTLGAIQHVNLIRLCGFCSEGSKRLLVYEYMPNGSLASHLFGGNHKTIDWKTRCQIMLGIARGLYYLHEQCRECIIHCDIKPENILLDSELYPKVADFGMAKLMGRDFSRVLTTLKGTIGYLAPEWIRGLPITTKADVYSFGMMALELISGRRNSQQFKDGNNISFFPLFAATKVAEGDVLSLIDKNLEDTVEMEELTRMCRLACWCIQDSETYRPSMGHIVQVLEGGLEVNIPPVPKSLLNLMEDREQFWYEESSLSSMN